MTENLADWISALVAAAALILSLLATRSAQKSHRHSEAMEEKNAGLVELQTKLAHERWSDEYIREIMRWACQVTTAISTAIHTIEDKDECRRLDVLITLSACIDMGRWYFPNRFHEDEGRHKPPAYRGYRQPVLDHVVEAYDIVNQDLEAAGARDRLVACQRHFVSCIQDVFDPRSREKVIGQALRDYIDVGKLRNTEASK